MKLSLVIPCYNEALNLPALVDRCAALAQVGDIEIVLVDNGSSDNTSQAMSECIAGHPAIRSIRIEVNKGYGFGIMSGLRAATGDILAWTHADQQTDPMDAAIGYRLFQEAASPDQLFVKGKRHGRPLVDMVFTAGMSVFETLLTQQTMRDINAQPTMFHRDFFVTWDTPPDDFALDLYAYWRAKQNKLQFRRFPVRFGPRLFGTSHWNSGMKARVKFIRRTLAFSLLLKKAQRG